MVIKNFVYKSKDYYALVNLKIMIRIITMKIDVDNGVVMIMAAFDDDDAYQYVDAN